MNIPFSDSVKPWHFLAITFAILLFDIPVILYGQNFMTFPIVLLYIIAGASPLLAAITLIYLKGNNKQRSDYWKRLIDIKRVKIGWYAIILLMFPVVNTIAILLSVLTGGSSPQFETAMYLLSAPLFIIPYVAFTLIVGPLPEELGWRGYALDGLQVRWNALSSNLFLGVIWALWHLPLFFIKGTFQNVEIGFLTLGFWFYMLEKIPSTILLAWVYNNNDRSTLSAVLFHFMINFSGELFSLTELARVYQTLLLIIITITIIIIWGPKTLTRQHEITS